MQRGLHIALACRILQISETCYQYGPILNDKDDKIADQLEQSTENKLTWGFGIWFKSLRNLQLYNWNQKRRYLIDCKLELNLQIKHKKRIKRDKSELLLVPDALKLRNKAIHYPKLFISNSKVDN